MKKIIHGDKKDLLKYYVCSSRDEMGKFGADLIRKYIITLLAEKQEIRIILASAPSQDEMLYHLTNNDEIDWSMIVGFDMDEYLGLPVNSEPRFKNYLKKNMIGIFE